MNSLAWVMLGWREYPLEYMRPPRYIRAEAPCWKGEVTVPIGPLLLTIGWQRAEAERQETER